MRLKVSRSAIELAARGYEGIGFMVMAGVLPWARQGLNLRISSL